MDTRNTPEITGMAQAIQQTMAEAGIKMELIPGDGQQTLTKYRARNHDIYIGRWGPDYQDPHTNADTFARNPDNSRRRRRPSRWPGATPWDIPEMTAKADAAVLEKDTDERAKMYLALQKEHQEVSPFVIMFQEIEVLGMRDDVKGFIIGPSFNDNSFAPGHEDTVSAVSPANTGGRWRALSIIRHEGPAGWSRRSLVTFLGLLLVTFLIGRVVPVDPVLAVVGDRASQSTYDAMYIELGLDKPLYQQFWIYLRDALSGDFGTSLLTKKDIADDIARVFPATLELATAGIIIGTLIGIPAGVLAAVRQGGAADQMVRVLGLVGYSAPIFWLGLLGLLVFYAQLGWVAGPGRIDIAYEYAFTQVTGILLIDTAMQGEWDAFRNVLAHLALPAMLLGLFLHGLHQPDDAVLHAGRAGAGIRHHRARQGRAGVADHLGPRAAQRRGAAGDRGGAELCGAARRLGPDRDGLRLAGARPVPDQSACRTPT